MTPEEEAYQEAQRRIAGVKSTGETKLSLIALPKLTTLPPEIAELTALTSINLWGSAVGDVTLLAGLQALTSLNLWGTGKLDLRPLSGLTSLTSLNLTGRPVSDLAPLAGLTALTTLELYDTEVSDLRPLAGLKALTSLNLMRTKVQDVGPLAGLHELTSLNLCETQVADLGALRNLSKLTKLDLDGCRQLSWLDLSETMLERLETLHINRCKFFDVPPELCGKGNYTNVAREVHAYARALREQGRGQLNECKLILLGNGRAGKTSTLKVLQAQRHNSEEPSTHAIRLTMLERWVKFADSIQPKLARVNAWDFGGQDIYHQAHRLFLRTRAVFIVCWNAWEKPPTSGASEGESHSLAYWLEQIHALHEDPRILIVRTHADRDEIERKRHRPEEVPDWREGVREEYRHHPCIALSCPAPEDSALNEIENWLKSALAAEISIGSRAVPRGWVDVRRSLEALQNADERNLAQGHTSDAVLSPENFAALVKGDLPEESALRDLPFIRSFLHDIGALYYDERLGGRIILDQRWAIQGIYAILQPGTFHEWLRGYGGTFTARDLRPEWSKLGYTDKDQELLLEFMQACGQIVRLTKGAWNASGDDVFLCPALLPTRDTIQASMFPEPVDEPPKLLKIEAPGLGRDVAREAIIAVAQYWSRSGRYWKWGAQLRTRTTGILARIEWEPLRPGSYEGSVAICVWGPLEEVDQFLTALRMVFAPALRGPLQISADRETSALYEVYHESDPSQRALLKQVYQRMQEKAAAIATAAQTEGASSANEGEQAGASKPALLATVADPEILAQGRYLSFSMAGADAENRDINSAPLALYEALKPLAEARQWDVFCYQRDTTQPDLRNLVRYVGKADFVVVFLSKKYLRSEYCMEELRTLYEAEPKGEFPIHLTRIFGFPGWRPANHQEWMALKQEWNTALKSKQQEWTERHREHFPDLEKVHKSVLNEPAYGWYMVCLDPGKLSEFQSALEPYATADAPSPFRPEEPACQKWLAKWVTEITHRLDAHGSLR